MLRKSSILKYNLSKKIQKQIINNNISNSITSSAKNSIDLKTNFFTKSFSDDNLKVDYYRDKVINNISRNILHSSPHYVWHESEGGKNQNFFTFNKNNYFKLFGIGKKFLPEFKKNKYKKLLAEKNHRKIVTLFDRPSFKKVGKNDFNFLYSLSPTSINNVNSLKNSLLKNKTFFGLEGVTPVSKVGEESKFRDSIFSNLSNPIKKSKEKRPSYYLPRLLDLKDFQKPSIPNSFSCKNFLFAKLKEFDFEKEIKNLGNNFITPEKYLKENIKKSKKNKIPLFIENKTSYQGLKNIRFNFKSPVEKAKYRHFLKGFSTISCISKL